MHEDWTNCACCRRAVRKCAAILVRVGEYDAGMAAVGFNRRCVCARCISRFGIVLPADHVAELAQGVLNKLARGPWQLREPEEVT